MQRQAGSERKVPEDPATKTTRELSDQAVDSVLASAGKEAWLIRYWEFRQIIQLEDTGLSRGQMAQLASGFSNASSSFGRGMVVSLRPPSYIPAHTIPSVSAKPVDRRRAIRPPRPARSNRPSVLPLLRETLLGYPSTQIHAETTRRLAKRGAQGRGGTDQGGAVYEYVGFEGCLAGRGWGEGREWGRGRGRGGEDGDGFGG